MKQPDSEHSAFTRRRLLKTAAAGTLALALPRSGAAAKAKQTAKSSGVLPARPADHVQPVAKPRAVPFDLADVRLLDGPFKHAQARDGAYLLFLEPDRLLHNFHVNAGLPPKAPIYGGWENAGVAGHIGGHYLSACSQMYRSTGDPRYRARVDYMVTELAHCQAKAPDGLVTAIPDARIVFAKVAADGTMTGWVPWYTMHKLYAGLRDSYQLCGNEQARGVLVKLSDWAIATTQNLTKAQMQSMMETEHGGMAESMADVYAITGDPKYLTMAHRFTHHAVFDPLAARQDKLDGLHSNTQIPKLIGYDRIHQLTGEASYGMAPLFFWQTVTGKRSYANGGNGDYEHFFPPTDFVSHVQSDMATETCCSYNMLKLTSAEFARDPRASYGDFYERTLFNTILASQDPDSGMMTYLTPMKPGHFRTYNDPVNAFWCCVGTGIENHAKYGDSLYFHAADGHALYVSQFVASSLRWRDKGVTLTQKTQFPEQGSTRLSLDCAAPTSLALKIRHPFWTSGMTVAVNGTPVVAKPGIDGFVTLNRIWKTGDMVDVRLPMTPRLEALPHTPQKQAVMVGPLMMVGAMGREGMGPKIQFSNNQAPQNDRPALPIPVFVGSMAELTHGIQPVSSKPLTFQMTGQVSEANAPKDVTLIPAYRAQDQRFNTYWSVYSPEDWAQHKAELARTEATQRALDALTLDKFLPGNQQSEVDHQFKSQNSNAGAFRDGSWRDARGGGWFEFTLKTTDGTGDPSPLILSCTYWGGDVDGRKFDILVDGTQIATQTLENNAPGQLFDVPYPIPPTLTSGKSAITVRLQAKPGMTAGGLFGCRLLRSQPDTTLKGPA